MRGFLRFIFGLIFIITTFILVMIFTLKSTILTFDYVKTRFNEGDVYTKVYNAIPELTKMVVNEAKKGEPAAGEELPLTGTQIGKIITDSVTPTLLKEKTEGFLFGFYNWIYGEGSEIPEISFTDIKPKIETYAAAEMNVPIAFLRSEGSGFSVPEKIRVEPIAPLLLIRRIYVNYNIIFFICFFLSVSSLIAIFLLAEDSLSGRIKKPGTPMIVVSIWLALSAGIFWIFFNASDLLFKMIAEKLGSAPQSETILYRLISGIITDITVIILAFAGGLLSLGIILKVVAHFIKKK